MAVTKKAANGAKVLIQVAGGALILVAGIMISVYVGNHLNLPFHFHNKLPANYSTDRDNFTNTIKYYSDAINIIDSHGDVNQVDADLKQSISSGNKVSDAFMDYLDPQLKNEFKNNLLTGEQDFVNGLEQQNTDNNSPGAVLQEQGLQLQNNWTSWWNAHNTSISKKAFAN